MVHLLLAILIGFIAYILFGLFASYRVAVVLGIVVGVLYYLSGGLGV
jgi:hypothetical protein